MKKNKPIIIATIAILVVFLFLGMLIIFSGRSDTILQDNLYFGGADISGLTKEAAVEKIYQSFQKMEGDGLSFKYNNDTATVPAITTSFNAEFSYQNFQFDRENIDAKLIPYGRLNIPGRLWQKLFNQKKVVIKPQYILDEDRVKIVISEIFPDSLNPAVDAAFDFKGNNIEITPDRPGKTIDWENLFTAINDNLNSFQAETITIKTVTEYPDIYSRDLKGLEQAAKDLSNKSLTLTFKEKSWPIEREAIASWLSVQKNNDEVSLNFNSSRVSTYLNEKFATEINTAPEDPRFEIKDNKVTSWQLGKDGYELDATSSAELIIKEYSQNKEDKKSVELITKVISPAPAESFDIKEIIGTGHSNFAGSPKNRRHNIEVGAAAVHGLVIKPGEEFSLVQSLGEIDASSGYLPELVIKGNKTIPEYGGGLCQIGTTVFRSALSSGLPITARQNHSYRVAYYEPAGTDAAIYDPNPDVRFLNDTKSNILIQARIEKDDIYFDFWGTKDGRVASSSVPVVYNIVKPPATKIIETDSLKPGEKKCTERAHNGADAYFDYTVIYPEGATTTLEQTRRFKSHYVPWQEVCLIGKSATSSPATSTPPVATSTVTTSTATTTTE